MTKNKILFSILITLFLLISISSVFAKDIAYIAKDASHLDSSIVSLLNQRGYTYDVFYQTNLEYANFSNYSMILVGEGIFSDYSKIPVNKKNSVILNTYYLDEWKWSGLGVSTISSNIPSAIVIYDETSPLVDGILVDNMDYTEFVPYNYNNNGDSYQLRYLSKSLDAPGLNTVVADDLSFLSRLEIYSPKSGAVIATMSKGGELRGGSYSEARGVFLGIPETSLWNQDSIDIFYNSIEWAINGEDKDEDGVMEDFDCDDNDAESYPGAEEIPYDGIDQNCDGLDLNDIDLDGFISELAGGDDCDDEDSEYNINSSDLTKNCLNDAPIIQQISRIQVSETETANLYIKAYDPENDSLIYSVEDIRFEQDSGNETHFSWQTDYEDAGDYTFNVIVSDGDLDSEKVFNVKVWNKNKAPDLLEEIPSQEWNEDELYTLDLTEYFSDIDGDNMIYLLDQMPNNSNIKLDKIMYGVAYITPKQNWFGETWIIFKATDGINFQSTNNITLNVLPINDAPVINTIPKINIYESEDASFYVSAYDPENDELEYSINDSRFEQNNNHFTWETGYDDFGRYTFEVSVTDREFTDESLVVVEVSNKNKAPELLEEIPTQEWDEDEGHTLNLSQYFYDHDGDNLSYFFHETSTDLNISADKIENGVVYFSSDKDWSGRDWISFIATDGINFQATNNVTLIVSPVNDAPALIKNNTNLTFGEDNIYILGLNNYFKDVDSQMEYSFESTNHLEITLEGNILKIVPEENWFGEDEFELTVNDEEFELSKDFLVKVESINDAPLIEDIGDIIVRGGDTIEIEVDASDIEEDELDYSINDIRFEQTDNILTWNTNEEDFGKYTFNVGVYDGENYSYKEVKVEVLQKILINEFVYGDEGWFELYNPENISFNLKNCTIEDSDNNELILNESIEGFGFKVFEWSELDEDDSITLNCYGLLFDEVTYQNHEEGKSFGRMPDGKDTNTFNDFQLFENPTKRLPNDADMVLPVVESVNPEDGSLFTETRNVLFEFRARDNADETLDCVLFVNEKPEGTKQVQNNSFDNFEVYFEDGIYNWFVECFDGRNYASSEERMINVSAPDSPKIGLIGNREVNENNILSFIIRASDADGGDLSFYIEDSPEEANFTDNEDSTASFAWQPNYNQSGTYYVKFLVRDETGLVTYENVSIKVNNVKEPPKFSDADVCAINERNSSISISIRDPDNGDEFEIGEIIDGEVKIKNSLEDDSKFDITVYLYDVEEEEVIEEVSEDIKIDEGESETYEFKIEIPKDTESEEFAIYVYVEESDGECNSAYNEITIERKKHDVQVDKIEINPMIVSPGDESEVSVRIKNLGTKDEDVVIKLEIPEIGFSKTTEEFEIEKFGKDDKETKKIIIVLPENTSEGGYGLKATVIYEDGENSMSSDIGVLKGEGGSNVNIVEESKPIKLGTGDLSGVIKLSDTPTSGNAISGNVIKAEKSKTKPSSTETALKISADEVSYKEEEAKAGISFNGASKQEKSSIKTIAIILGIGIALIILIMLVLFLLF